MMCHRREDSKKGTVRSLTLLDGVICRERGPVRCGRNMLRSEVTDEYLTHHYGVPINAAGKELHCGKLKLASVCTLLLHGVSAGQIS